MWEITPQRNGSGELITQLMKHFHLQRTASTIITRSFRTFTYNFLFQLFILQHTNRKKITELNLKSRPRLLASLLYLALFGKSKNDKKFIFSNPFSSFFKQFFFNKMVYLNKKSIFNQ